MLRSTRVSLVPGPLAEGHSSDLRTCGVVGSFDWSDESVSGRHFMRWPVTQTPKRFLLRGSLLSLCLAAFCVCDARPAWATCGDYLAGHGDQAMASHAIPSHDSSAGLPSRDSEPTPVCTGPQCHQRDPVPAAPSRSVQLPQSSDAILCIIARLTVGDESSLFHVTPAEHVVEGPVNGLFRPPRVA